MSEADELTVVVLAAGGGTRMKSKTMKVLHHIGGRSMIGHVLTAVRSVEPHRVVAVIGHQRELVGAHVQGLVPDVVLAIQEVLDGTGGAVRVALAASGTTRGTVIVATGDTPLLEGESLKRFVAEHRAAEQVVSILSGIVANPYGYGRILRNDEGDVEGIVEEKDASPQQREIHEISSGILAFDAEFLVGALPRLTNDNAKGEYYLTDTVKIAREDGLTVGAFPIDDVMQTEGANDRVQLAEMGREMNRRIVTRWMRDGVTVMDPATTWIDADVKLAEDVTILPGVQLLGATVVAEDAVIGPDTTLKDCEVGVGARVVRAHAELSVIGDGAEVGPFARLRPGRRWACAARSAPSWRPRTPRSATARRCRTCRTSATRRSARAPTSGRARSSPTTTGSPRAGRSWGSTRRPAPTTPSSPRSRSATARRPAAAPSSGATCPRGAGRLRRPAAQPAGLGAEQEVGHAPGGGRPPGGTARRGWTRACIRRPG